MLGHQGIRANSVSYLTVVLLLLFSAGIAGDQATCGSGLRAAGAILTEPGNGATATRVTAVVPEDGPSKVAANPAKAATDPARAAAEPAKVTADPAKPEAQPVDAKEEAPKAPLASPQP